MNNERRQDWPKMPRPQRRHAPPQTRVHPTRNEPAPTITEEEIRAVRDAGGCAGLPVSARDILRTLADKLENEARNPQD